MASYSEDLHSAALAYHRLPRPGKLEIQAIKPLANQRDLALAYSPGVAAACTAIAADPAQAASLTIRANLVAVVSNGTAVLGLGNIGPLASKPVMEGKAVLFKKFAGIDVFDIEIAADTIERVVETVAALEPTFGGINLEDIKGPECFEIEAQLKARMKIPVFHDDQHGTAIIVGAAITNALLLNGKQLSEVKIVTSGAGAAAIACLNLLVSMGAQRKNIWVCDIDGVPWPDLIVADASQEHGIIEARPGSGAPLPDLPIGSRVRILPNHACATGAQHESYQVVENGNRSVVATWPRMRGW